MRDSNFQIGGTGNRQQITNKSELKNWQNNILLYVIVGVVIAVLGFWAAKFFGVI